MGKHFFTQPQLNDCLGVEFALYRNGGKRRKYRVKFRRPLTPPPVESIIFPSAITSSGIILQGSIPLLVNVGK